MTTAREIMTADVETIDIREVAQEAASRMAQNDIGAIPVCDEDGHLRGMITDRDITIGVVARGLDPAATSVGDVIERTEVVTIGADDPIEDALRTMKQYKVRRLPVIDGDRIVGVLSQGDIAVHLPDGQVGELVEAISAAP